jgi:hypothetical protein
MSPCPNEKYGAHCVSICGGILVHRLGEARLLSTARIDLASSRFLRLARGHAVSAARDQGGILAAGGLPARWDQECFYRARQARPAEPVAVRRHQPVAPGALLSPPRIRLRIQRSGSSITHRRRASHPPTRDERRTSWSCGGVEERCAPDARRCYTWDVI